mgnify:CR=1 FL=1
MNILFPTDFSPNSKVALSYATDFIKKVNGKLTLAHITHVPVMESLNLGTLTDPVGGPTERLQKRVEEDKVESIVRKLEELRSEFGLTEENCTCTARNGQVKSEIDKLFKENNFHLVVMGTRGENTQSGFFFGGMAEHLLKEAECPVMAIPPGSEYKGVKRIVYATNLMHDEKGVLNWLTNYARLNNSRIHLIHINDEGSQNTKEQLLLDLIKEVAYDNITFEILEGSAVTDLILEISKDGETDVLSLTTHTTTLMERIFHSSITEEVLQRVNIPFIGFSEKDTTPYNFNSFE